MEFLVEIYGSLNHMSLDVTMRGFLSTFACLGPWDLGEFTSHAKLTRMNTKTQ